MSNVCSVFRFRSRIAQRIWSFALVHWRRTWQNGTLSFVTLSVSLLVNFLNGLISSSLNHFVFLSLTVGARRADVYRAHWIVSHVADRRSEGIRLSPTRSACWRSINSHFSLFFTSFLAHLQEGKKKFDKETTKFCQSLERHLNLSTKKSENHLQEVSDNELAHHTKA